MSQSCAHNSEYPYHPPPNERPSADGGTALRLHSERQWPGDTHRGCWALARAFWLMMLVCVIGCSRPDIDGSRHARPSLAERKLAEANWQRLERAYMSTNLGSARSLIGCRILFAADVDYRGARVTARQIGTYQGMPIPCRWNFTRMQRRVIRSCCSVGVEVYGTLQGVAASGIQVEPHDFGIMVCL